MRTKEQQEAINRSKCRYFTGVQNDKCEAGICYASFRDKPGRLPCIPYPDEVQEPCEKYSPLTEEEYAEQRMARTASIQRINAARRAIVEYTKGQRGVRGSIKCPCCSAGELGFSVAGSNGHIHARCTTPNCVCWME